MKTAYIIKIDPSKGSKFGGTYIRVYFRDMSNQNQTYILDVNNASKHWIKHLEEGNYFSHLSVFSNQRNGKLHIDGKRAFVFEGKVVKKSNVGFTLM